MSRIKRYLTAFRRYNRSNGFGIHSPFAFYFVRRVLREKNPYYAYETLYKCRRSAMKLVRGRQLKKQIISYQNAKMLFRIACYFRPKNILQIGTSYGISAISMLSIDCHSHLVIYPGAGACFDIFDMLTSEQSHRIENTLTIDDAIQRYNERLENNNAFVLINSVDNISDAASALTAVVEALQSGGVVIMRNLNTNAIMKQLWHDCNMSLHHGMSFTNYRIGIFVGLKHLPRQNFAIWF